MCVHLILDANNNIVNRAVFAHEDPITDYTPDPGLTIYPDCEADGADRDIGGTLVNGVYTPPPEAAETADESEA